MGIFKEICVFQLPLYTGVTASLQKTPPFKEFNPLNAELNPICCLLALLRAHHFLHVSRAG
jgi:hypothetical protein